MSTRLVDDNALFDDDKASLSRIEDVTGLRDGQLREEVAANQPRLRGRTLTYALAFVAGTGFTLFGFVSPLEGSKLLAKLQYLYTCEHIVMIKE